MSKRVVVAVSCALLAGLMFLGLAIQDSSSGDEEPAMAALAERLGLDRNTNSMEQIATAIVERLPRYNVANRVWIQALSLDGPFAIGDIAVLEFQVPAHATCKLEVRYASKDESTSVERNPERVADASGRVRWEWTIQTATRGTAVATLHVTPEDGTEFFEVFTFFVGSET